MDVETGLTRLARVIEVLGLLWVVLCAAGIVMGFATGKDHPSDMWFIVGAAAIMGAVGYGIAWALAWIVRGFAQKRA